MKLKNLSLALAAVLGLAVNQAALASQQVQVTITNIAPSGGTVLTPVWVGFHDGSFDSYNGGLTSQPGLERLAEDGDTMQITEDFGNNLTYVNGGVSTTTASTQVGTRIQDTIGSMVGPPPLQPGDSESRVFTIETDGSNEYFSYASMILPSNDFFVANGSPVAHSLASLYDGDGSISFNIGLAGTVNDAGTEAEDFDTAAPPLGGLNALFPGAGFAAPAGQDGPNEGPADPNSLIRNVVGDPYASFANVGGADLSALDFNQFANGIATITITVIPEPTSVALVGLGLVGLCGATRRRR